MRADRERQADFHAFAAFRCPDFCAAAFGHDEGRVNEAFSFVQR
jgi:hypothetical protein